MRTGSSPLTRGKQGLDRLALWEWGLIPAHAGKTLSRMLSLRCRRDHPRSRGENTPRDQHWCSCKGSSPLTRGKHARVTVKSSPTRIIPAHAGKTECACCVGHGHWAHPRSRRENASASLSKSLTLGSSPLTRGKRLTNQDAKLARGLIPAHAGKTPDESGCQAGAWAHPRSRGENTFADSVAVALVGSSPLTRGKLRRLRAPAASKGLIPAHAGKTNGSDWSSNRRPGSSPLTRGKLQARHRSAPRPGLIPAHAGKTRILRLTH